MRFEKADTDPASQEAVSEGGATSTTPTTMAVACTEALPSASGRSFKLLQVLLVCVSNRETNESRQTLCLLDVGADRTVTIRHGRLGAGRLGAADYSPGLLCTWTFMRLDFYAPRLLGARG